MSPQTHETMKNPEYEKMPKSLKNMGLNEKALQELEKVKWTVTEKVHGANFSFVYENHSLGFAKRKDFLKWTDDFFGFQTVAMALENKIMELFEQLSLDVKAERYILYGELFGGKYPHPEVQPDEQVQAIQTGVYYCPSVSFCAFDLAFESGDQKHYLDYEAAIGYFERFGIFHATPLFTGRFNEALSFNTRIPSAIPAQLGLPPLEGNIIEGVVIKPMNHSKLKELSERPILKLKNKEFDEEKKFHEAEKWSYIPEARSQSEELSFIVEEMSNYINRNRLDSVLSKTGALKLDDHERLREIKAEFLQDILTDFDLEHKLWKELSETEKQWIEKRISAGITGFIFSFHGMK